MLVTAGDLRYIRRLRKGLTQREMADCKGLSLYAYRQLEEDEGLLGQVDMRSWYEELLVRRRRSGWTIEELAGELGISSFWYRQLEKDCDDRVRSLLCDLTRGRR